MTGTSVQICRRVTRFLPYIFVEILDGILELLSQEIGHSTAEIHAHVAGTQVQSVLEILQGRFIFTETAACDTSVMITVSEYRIYAYRTVKIILGTSDISQVIFGNASEEVVPIIGRIQTGEDIEILDCSGILSIRKSLAAPHIEDILVVLGIKTPKSCHEKQNHNYCKFQGFMHFISCYE
jgi:hypothetical protein